MVMGDIATGTDVLVIGGGPGGYVAAIRAAQLGLATTLVEKDAYGGTCLNDGCIPSKALITGANLAHDAANGEHIGVSADPEVDMAAMSDWKDDVVDRLTGGVETLCEANGVDLVEGTAAFEDEHTVRVAHGGEGQGMETIEFEYCIVATGSRPVRIPGFDFADEAVPDELVVVGAGYVGMELSTTFAKLGSDVTVVEALDDVLPGYEDDVARVVRTRAESIGVEFEFGEVAAGWEPTEASRIAVSTEAADGTRSSYDADRVLVAVGREPVTDTLELESVDLSPDEDGFLATDDRTRTDVEHVFAVGDVAGGPMLAHKASAEGLVAAGVAAGENAAVDHQAIPSAVFTDPEVGTVGMTEAEAEEAGFDALVGHVSLRTNGRALTRGDADGFVRLVAEADAGFVLGAQIVAPEASELVAEAGLAIEMGARLDDLVGTVHTHPTVSEAVAEAAADARGRAIHALDD
jgi:dihydrolipoamide dehydrogenase